MDSGVDRERVVVGCEREEVNVKSREDELYDELFITGIDEGAEEDEQTLYPNTIEDNWRTKSDKPDTTVNKFGHQNASFSRFPAPEWKNARVAAKHLKMCPGDQCKLWLPLYNFGSNLNMEDGLDVYCISCNNRKRSGRKKKDKKRNFYTKPVLDKYEQFRVGFVSNTPPPELTSEQKSEEAVNREVNKRISSALTLAEKRFKRKIPADTVEIARKLFMRKRFACGITGAPLTPKCFVEHHSLAFELRERPVMVNNKTKRVVDIVCSDCRVSN